MGEAIHLIETKGNVVRNAVFDQPEAPAENGVCYPFFTASIASSSVVDAGSKCPS